MRLFLALNFDAPTTKRLAKLRDTAADYCPGARFTPDENLHLTLVFLGEVQDPAPVLEIVKRCRMKPIPVEFNGTRQLGDGLLCVGVKQTPALMALQAELAAALEKAGFALEAREFLPHVTLARRFTAQGYRLQFAPFSTTVARVSLMKSEPCRGGMRYTELF